MGKLTLTDAIQDELCKYLQSGVTIADACAMVGIGESTYYEWVQIGEAYINGQPHDRMPHKINDRARLAEFADTVKKARSLARYRNIGIIQKVAAGDKSTGDKPNWQAAAWFLERSDPTNWARRTYGKIEGLEELIRLADTKGINASELFNAMLMELASADSTDDSTQD